MAIKGRDGADLMIQMLQDGVSYAEADCIEAAVRRPIHKCPGGDPSYRIGGCTQLWDSYEKSGKYHDITERMTIAEWMASGRQLVGDLLVIYDAGSGVCEHVAYYLGGYRGYEAIHSSQSRGGVYETHVKNGFTHVLRHRLIAGEPASGDVSPEPVPGGDSVIYRARVETQRDPLRMRSGPGTQYDVVGHAQKGAVVDVLAEPADGWTYISADGQTGYAANQYLQRIDEPAPVPDPEPEPEPIVTTTITNGEAYITLIGSWRVALD